MALIEQRNRLLLMAGVKRADMEKEPSKAQLEHIEQTDTIVRFRWKPQADAGPVYELQYTSRQALMAGENPIPGEPPDLWRETYTLTWFCDEWQGPARVFEWCEHSYIHGNYLANKMDISKADANHLILLLEALGHRVSYCDVSPHSEEHAQIDRSATLTPGPACRTYADWVSPTPVLVEETEDAEGVDNASR
jgi:hypothetical protein